MAMIIGTNEGMFKAYNDLRKHKKKYDKSFGQVITGMKVRDAKDNASAFGISENMRKQIHALENDRMNIQNSSALLQIAANSLNEVIDEMRGLKKLATNAANDVHNSRDRMSIQKELEARIGNINFIARDTEYNGFAIIDGTFAAKVDENGVAHGRKLIIHQGTDSGQAVWLYLESMKTEDLREDIVDENGDFIDNKDLIDLWALSSSRDKKAEYEELLRKAHGMTLADISMGTAYDSRIAMRVIDGALDKATTEAAKIGAYQQRMEFNLSNVLTTYENISAAESNIRDTDYSESILEMTKNKFFMDSAQSMLAQANSNAGNVLSLLQ